MAGRKASSTRSAARSATTVGRGATSAPTASETSAPAAPASTETQPERDPAAASRSTRTVDPAKQYGESQKEEHRKSGYRMPDDWYREPIPPEERVEGGPMYRDEVEGKRAKSPAAENKSASKADENK